MNRQLVEINPGTPVTDDGCDWLITVVYPNGVRMDVRIPKEEGSFQRPDSDCLYPDQDCGLNLVSSGHYT